MKTVPWKVHVLAELNQTTKTYIVFSSSSGNASKKALNRFKKDELYNLELGRGHGDILVRISRSSIKEADGWIGTILR